MTITLDDCVERIARERARRQTHNLSQDVDIQHIVQVPPHPQSRGGRPAFETYDDIVLKDIKHLYAGKMEEIRVQPETLLRVAPLYLQLMGKAAQQLRRPTVQPERGEELCEKIEQAWQHGAHTFEDLRRTLNLSAAYLTEVFLLTEPAIGPLRWTSATQQAECVGQAEALPSPVERSPSKLIKQARDAGIQDSAQIQQYVRERIAPTQLAPSEREIQTISTAAEEYRPKPIPRMQPVQKKIAYAYDKLHPAPQPLQHVVRVVAGPEAHNQYGGLAETWMTQQEQVANAVSLSDSLHIRKQLFGEAFYRTTEVSRLPEDIPQPFLRARYESLLRGETATPAPKASQRPSLRQSKTSRHTWVTDGMQPSPVRGVSAEYTTWAVARTIGVERNGVDSRAELERLGFSNVRARTEESPFYRAEPPRGWTKHTNGQWTHILDEHGRVRLIQTYQARTDANEAMLIRTNPYKQLSLQLNPYHGEGAQRFGTFMEDLSNTLAMPRLSLSDSLKETVLREIARTSVSYLRDALLAEVGVQQSMREIDLSPAQLFVWRYSFPLHTALDERSLLPRDLLEAAVSGFGGAAPYPLQHAEQWGLDYTAIAAQRPQLERATRETLGNLLPIISNGFRTDVQVHSSHTIPNGMRIEMHSYVHGAFSVRDGRVELTQLEQPPKTDLRLTANPEQPLPAQFASMEAVERIAANHLFYTASY